MTLLFDSSNRYCGSGQSNQTRHSNNCKIYEKTYFRLSSQSKVSITKKAAESDRCPSFHNSCLSGKPTLTKTESTLADGLAVSLVGVNCKSDQIIN